MCNLGMLYLFSFYTTSYATHSLISHFGIEETNSSVICALVLSCLYLMEIQCYVSSPFAAQVKNAK